MYRVKRHHVVQPKSYRLIPLTQNQNAKVSIEDFEPLSKFNWYALWDSRMKSFYALRRIKDGKLVSMHAQILGCKKGEEGDHKNHDTLDNRRGNLRKACRAQNAANQRIDRADNKSGYKGVYWDKKWRADIKAEGRTKHLGYFELAGEAARAYDIAAKKYFGEFAVLNFPRAT